MKAVKPTNLIWWEKTKAPALKQEIYDGGGEKKRKKVSFWDSRQKMSFNLSPDILVSKPQILNRSDRDYP